MTETIYFQWQNKYLCETIYPVRDMKLRHFLLYYYEIDLWAKYKDKKIEDLQKEKEEYESAQKRAAAAAYKAEGKLRDYFMDTGVDTDPQDADDKKTRFAKLMTFIQNSMKDDAVRDEIEWLKDALLSLHSNFSVYFEKFKQERNERSRDRKEKVYVAMRIAEWERHRKELKQRIARRTNLLAVMDEKSRITVQKAKELKALEKTVLPLVEVELRELRKFVVAQNRLEKRKAEFEARQDKYLEQEATLLTKLAEPTSKIAKLSTEQKRLEREIMRLTRRATPKLLLEELTKTEVYETIRSRLAESKLPVDPRVIETIINTVRGTIDNDNSGFYNDLKQLIQPWIDRGANTDFAWILTSLTDQAGRLRQAQKKIKNVVMALEAGLKSMSSGSEEWTLRKSTIDVLDDGMMIEILDDKLDQLEILQASIADSQKDDTTLNGDLAVARKKLQEVRADITELKRELIPDEQALDDVRQSLHVTRDMFLREYVPDGVVDVKKDILPFKSQQHYQWLEKLNHGQLLHLVFDLFYKEPERFPLWLQYMVVHFSGMRYASAHGSWADPRDMLLNLRTLDLQEDYKKSWIAELEDDDPNDDDFSDQEIEVACQAKVDFYEPLAVEPDGKRGARPLTALGRAIVAKPKSPGADKSVKENPVRIRMKEYYLDRLKSLNPDTRRRILLDLRIEEENYEIQEMKPKDVLEQLKTYESRIPPWMWDEIVKLTDLRLTEVDSKDWETLTAAQQADRLSNTDKKMAKYREIMNDWKKKNLTGWREEHEQSSRLIVTRAVCNEVAEHIQHLRGHEGASGLTQKPFWYMREESKFLELKPRPKGSRPYFVRAKDRGGDRHNFEVGASILWLRFVNDSPNEWRVAKDMATHEGDELVDPRYQGRQLESGGWVYKKGEPISRMRQKFDQKEKAIGAKETQYLRWMHEATVAAVAKTHEGTVALTFETALPYEDPSLATIGVFKRYLPNLIDDLGEDGYNPAFVGFMPEGKIPVKAMEEMLDWNHILLEDVFTPAELEAYRNKYIRKRKPTAPTVEFIRDLEDEKPKPVIGLLPKAEYLKWTEAIAQPGTNMYRVRRWGDKALKGGDLDVNKIESTNFQAIGLYNKATNDFGAVANFIEIQRDDIDRLKAMQVDDVYLNKHQDWRGQKMDWLCQYEGSIYMFGKETDSWESSLQILWGTLALGGNLVQVQDFEPIEVKVKGFDGVEGVEKVKGGKVRMEMGRLVGFQKKDWFRPLDDLLKEGLVHRCFCAGGRNQINDSPQGIVYSPFFGMTWKFRGTEQPDALYIPRLYLEEQGSISPVPEDRSDRPRRGRTRR